MKILTANSGRIGDFLFSMSVLPVLKSAYPDSQIGFLASSWTRELVEDHIHVDWVHTYDHPRVNRDFISQRQKKKVAKRSWARAFCEIKKRGYDHAIELHSYSRDQTGPLFYMANIPKRSAYWRCNTPYFFNDLLFFGDAHFNLVENYGWMMQEMGIEKKHLAHLKVSLEYKNQISTPIINQLPSDFFLIHMGSADPCRLWDHSHWIKLLGKVKELGVPLVFVGKGSREKRRVEEAIRVVPDAVDLCDKVTLRELMEVIKRARHVIGVESMTAHLTAALDVPGLFVYSGQAVVSMWRPYSKKCEIVLPANFDFTRYHAPVELLQTVTADQVFERLTAQVEKKQL